MLKTKYKDQSFFDKLNKSGVLKNLNGRIRKAKILPQYAFSYLEWSSDSNYIISKLFEEKFCNDCLIVRSSASQEDSVGQSSAGAYTSVLNVQGKSAIRNAISEVFLSFGREIKNDDMVFIQPMLKNVELSGVVFTTDPSNGAPYFVIDYAYGNDTTVITAGQQINGATAYIHHSRLILAPEKLKPVINLSEELIEVTNSRHLDIEFGVDGLGEVYLFQLRPLHVNASFSEMENQLQERSLVLGQELFKRLKKSSPHVNNQKTMLGNMPDWNPAEIIGVRPKPLALSLYKEMITDRIWAYQRDKYGYKNLRSAPLLYSIAGSPFIDIKTCFYSFVPKMVSEDLSARLVEYYINKLSSAPELHDKIEFEIVFSCYTPSLPRKLQELKKHGFTDSDLTELAVSLKHLTNRVTHSESGEWRVDRGKIDILRYRQLKLAARKIDSYDYIFWLAEDCKRYGTLAFAGLARAAFVATQFLNSMGEEGVLSKNRIEQFWVSLETMGSNISRDFYLLDREVFLEKYGHLRPGTYDIVSDSYSEKPERYFDWQKDTNSNNQPDSFYSSRDFSLSNEEEKKVQTMLDMHGIQHTPQSLFRFFKAAIEGREYGKFIFSWSIDRILKQVESLGKTCGFSREDCSFINFQELLMNYSYSSSIEDCMGSTINRGKANYNILKKITLPNLICDERDLWCFEIKNGSPNYITLGQVSGEVFALKSGGNYSNIKNKIVLIESADPGYDWILTAGIKAFVTCYGGANSHMAVRALELDLPAVVGVGERAFKKWTAARNIEINCAQRRIVKLI